MDQKDCHEYKIDAGIILDVVNDLPVIEKIKDIRIGNDNKVLFHVQSFYDKL